MIWQGTWSEYYLHNDYDLEWVLVGGGKPMILNVFLLGREWGYKKPALAFVCDPTYIPSDAEVPRHTPDARRDAHPDRRHALTTRLAALCT